jgi:hypothetical protein
VLGRKLVKSNFTGDTKVALTLTMSPTQGWHGDPNNRCLSSVHSKTIAVLGLTFRAERESVLRDLGWYVAASGRRGLVRRRSADGPAAVAALVRAQAPSAHTGK